MTHDPTSARSRTTRTIAALAVGALAALGLAACSRGTAASSPRTVSPTSEATGSRPTTTTPTTLAKSKGKGPGTKPTTTTTPGATIGNGLGAAPPPMAGRVTFVGDSVGVDAAPYLQQDIPGIRVEAMVDRSWGEGEVILQQLASQGELGSVVVVELGLNGPIDDADFRSMMAILIHVPRVVFLNIRLPLGAYGPGTDWWQDQNNSVLAEEIPHYHNALLANWYVYSAGHPSWYAPDGIHLNPPGGAAMAQLVKDYA